MPAPSNGTADAFLVISQSNGVVTPSQTAGSPQFADGQACYWDETGLVSLSGTGGPWASFGQIWFNATQRAAIIIPAGIGGSSLLAAADHGFGNWSPTGLLLPRALSMHDAALAYIEANTTYTLYTNAAGQQTVTGTLYALGEADAAAYNRNTAGVNYANEMAAINDLKSVVRQATGSSGFYISRAGTDPTTKDDGFLMVRTAQADTSNPYDVNAMVMFDQAVNFQNYGMVSPQFGAEYTQAGYNLMGQRMTENIRVFFASVGL